MGAKMTETLRKPTQLTCVWCGSDTTITKHLRHEVHALWGPVSGDACPNCMETHMGRRLRHDDFTPKLAVTLEPK